MIGFHQQGHRVISLSQAEGHFIHEILTAQGIETYSFIPRSNANWVRFGKHFFYLIKFCRQNRVDVVYSHLEPANVISVFAQYFIRARVYICRHHVDQLALINQSGRLSYRLIYSLARNIIVVSEAARNYMIREEKIPARKIITIPLGYDFDLYPPVRAEEVARLKALFNCSLTLVTAGSLSSLKRPELAVEVLDALRTRGFDCKLIFLGEGPLKDPLLEKIERAQLMPFVRFEGYVGNILEFFNAADILLHPSISESSCVVVKEAGLAELPVIVCKGVGDFDEYIIHDHNGWLVHPDHFVTEALTLIIRNHDQSVRERIGKMLRAEIRSRFSVERALKSYQGLNNN